MKFAYQVIEAYLTSYSSSSSFYLFFYFLEVVSTYDVMFIFNDYSLLSEKNTNNHDTNWFLVVFSICRN